jgi:hypothetical protein
MRMILGFLFIVLVFSLLLICGGVVMGSLLRVVFPSVDRGTSILLGVITCTSSIYFMQVIVQKVPIVSLSEDEYGGVDDDDDDLGGEPEPVRPPVWILPPTDQPSGKRRRKRR